MNDKTPLTTLAWCYLALGGIMVALAVLVSSGVRETMVALMVIGVLPSAWIGLKVHGLPRAFIGGLSIVGGLYVMYSVVDMSMTGSAGEVVAGSIDLIATFVITVLLTITVHRRRGRLDIGDLLDGLIIAIAVWLIAWIGLVRPAIGADDENIAVVLLDASYLPLAVPLVLLTMMFLFSGRLDRAANWLLASALILNVSGDLIYALEETRGLGTWAFVVADTIYIAAFAATGATFIHPTARELLADGYARTKISLPGRAVGLAAALVIPVVVLALLPATSTADVVVRSVSSMLLLGLVALRLYQSTTASIKNQQRLLDAARIDDLTGLPNKSALLEIATDSIDHSWRTNRCPSLYLFDLDRFKNINDSLGHSSGDDVIVVLAERLRLAAASLGASVGRPAGDEFLVFDPTPTSEHQALNHAEVLHSVFKEPLTTGDGVVFVTASVGVASMPQGRPVSGEEIFRWADIAMYRAKDSGRNCLALYNSSMQDHVSQRMRVETELHGALEKGQFKLFHQPIVELETGRVSGFEALIRWQKPDGTMVSPAQFIPIAEDTGLISEIGAWALIEGLTQLDSWTEDGVIPPATTMSVNVSPRQLADPHFPDVVEEALRRTGVDAHRLWLEVTESVMVENPEVARTSLRRIRAMGPRIALDDFGTGYSSLSLLQQFPIQRIKIDRAFVKGLDDSPNDRSLVRTVINLGESLGLDIVAEGVETIDQLRQLREFSCDKAQGFLISHPVPPEAIRSTVAALESLSQWPEFSSVVGGDPLHSGPLRQH